MRTQAIFARTKGYIAWPRWNTFNTGNNNNSENRVDFNDGLKLPAHDTLISFTARYQFRRNWGVRYQIMGKDFNGGGTPDEQFQFGPGNTNINYNQDVTSNWIHTYNRAELIYDALKNCSSVVSVFAGWMHADDKISLSCRNCGSQQSTFSRSTDSMIAGLEVQRCIKTAFNGGTLSFDHKGGVIFLDDVEGYDLETSLRYSIPLNCGRAGFFRGGYRFTQMKKGTMEYYLEHAIEGGFVEGGFIF